MISYFFQAKDRAKIRKCDSCGGRSSVDIREVTSILRSFCHIFKEYEEEMLYCRFDYEKLLDTIAETTVEIVDAFRETFDAKTWLEVHQDDETEEV